MRRNYESLTLQEEKSSAKNALFAALHELQAHLTDNPLGAQLIANLTRLLANEDDWEQAKNLVRNIVR
jgi:hypothetical protein